MRHRKLLTRLTETVSGILESWKEFQDDEMINFETLEELLHYQHEIKKSIRALTRVQVQLHNLEKDFEASRKEVSVTLVTDTLR